MKTLMFGWEFPPVISGGLGTACFGLTKGLTDKGVDVTFVLPTLSEGAGGSHVELVGADSIELTHVEAQRLLGKLERIPVNSPLAPYLSGKEYGAIITKMKAEEKQDPHTIVQALKKRMTGNYGPELMSEITRYSSVAGAFSSSREYDVIHAHDWMTYPAGIEARKRNRRPLVAHVHATESDRNGDNINREVYEIEREGLHAADRVIAVSDFTKRKLIRHYGIEHSRIDIVHNGILNAEAASGICGDRGLSEKIVLFLGRITFQKGPEYFIEAAKKVTDRIPDVRFVMAGTGDMFPRMVEKMAAMRMGKYFHFTGFLRGAEVDRMYAMSDLYVMPSVSEPFGITPLEAMRYDIPVIISKQSGVAEVAEHAVKVDFWDIDRLADTIVDILADEQGARRMVCESRKRLAGLSWHTAADKVIQTYRKAACG